MLKLAMALPGKNAKKFRADFANILLRFHAGDESLVAEIERNRESTHPINETAREALNEELAGGNGGIMLTQEDLVRYEGKLEDTHIALEETYVMLDEAQTALVKHSAQLQAMPAMMNACAEQHVQAFIRTYKESEKSRRTKELNDLKTARKHEENMVNARAEAEVRKKIKLDAAELEKKKKFDEIELEKKRKFDEAELEKQEKEHLLKAKAFPMAVQYDDIDERRHRREIMRLEKERELKCCSGAPEATPTGDLTARNVGTFYGLFNNVHERWIIRISNDASDMIQKPPYNIQPIDRVLTEKVGKKQPSFAVKNLYTLKDVIMYCKMDENKFTKDLSVNPDDTRNDTASTVN